MKFRTVLIVLIFGDFISTSNCKKSTGGSRGGDSSPNVAPIPSNTGVGLGAGARPSSGTGIGNSGVGARPTNFGSGGTAVGSPKKGGFLSSPTSKVVAAGLAGAAVGAAGYALIKAGTSSHYSAETGRTYYYGDRYYTPTGSSANRLVCKYRIETDDDTFRNLIYEDQTRVTEIIFQCDSRTEKCCELDCCKLPAQQQRPAVVVTERRGIPWWGGLLIFIMLGAFFGLIGYCIYSRIKRGKLGNSQQDATYVVESVETHPYGYPEQQFAQNQGPTPYYPPQNQNQGPTPYYPPQPGYANPPAPGYSAGQPPQSGYPPQQNYGQQGQQYPAPYPQQQQQYH